jgi:hypothetical protein
MAATGYRRMEQMSGYPDPIALIIHDARVEARTLTRAERQPSRHRICTYQWLPMSQTMVETCR